MLRELKMEDVEFELIVHEDAIPVRGNAMASGDDGHDKDVEDDIIDQLNRGNIWAWCTVEVKATFGRFSESDFLDGCSYNSEADFMAGGYYEDMKAQALHYLDLKIRAIYAIYEDLQKLKTA